MSKTTKHAPGPWFIGTEYWINGYDDSPGDSPLRVFPIGSANQDEIAFVRADNPVGEANARLIRAAPELLTELKRWAELIAAEYPQQQEIWLEETRALLAKIEGDDQ